jgi:hypothetical protein
MVCRRCGEQQVRKNGRDRRGVQVYECCGGHSFMRNLRDGFCTLGVVMGDPRIPRPPRLMRTWDALTAQLLVG